MLASLPPQNPILRIKFCRGNNEESLIRAKAFCKYPLWGKVIWSCSFVSEKPLKQCTICYCLVEASRDLFRQSGLRYCLPFNPFGHKLSLVSMQTFVLSSSGNALHPTLALAHPWAHLSVQRLLTPVNVPCLDVSCCTSRIISRAYLMW